MSPASELFCIGCGPRAILIEVSCLFGAYVAERWSVSRPTGYEIVDCSYEAPGCDSQVHTVRHIAVVVRVTNTRQFVVLVLCLDDCGFWHCVTNFDESSLYWDFGGPPHACVEDG